MGIGSESFWVDLSVCGYLKLALAGCSDEDEEGRKSYSAWETHRVWMGNTTEGKCKTR